MKAAALFFPHLWGKWIFGFAKKTMGATCAQAAAIAMFKNGRAPYDWNYTEQMRQPKSAGLWPAHDWP